MSARRLVLVPLAGALALATLTACSSSDPLASDTSDTTADAGSVVIGSADFSESQLVATIYSLALQDAGVDVTEKFAIGSREVYMEALQDGSIDLIPEYGGSLLKYLEPDTTVSAREDVLTELGTVLPDGLTLLEASQAEDKDTVSVTAATAEQYDLTTISDLAPVASELTLGGPAEWKTRATGVPGLESVYGLTFKEFVTLDAGGPLTLAALTGGQIQVGNIFSTDPAISTADLVSLEDDKSLFPAEPVVPVISSDKDSDTIDEVLGKVSAALTTEGLIDMNAQAADGAALTDIAQAWLDENDI